MTCMPLMPHSSKDHIIIQKICRFIVRTSISHYHPLLRRVSMFCISSEPGERSKGLFRSSTISPFPNPALLTNGLMSLIWLLLSMNHFRLAKGPISLMRLLDRSNHSMLTRLANDWMSLTLLFERLNVCKLKRLANGRRSLIWLLSMYNHFRLVRVLNGQRSLTWLLLRRNSFKLIAHSSPERFCMDLLRRERFVSFAMSALVMGWSEDIFKAFRTAFSRLRSTIATGSLGSPTVTLTLGLVLTFPALS